MVAALVLVVPVQGYQRYTWCVFKGWSVFLREKAQNFLLFPV